MKYLLFVLLLTGGLAAQAQVTGEESTVGAEKGLVLRPNDSVHLQGGNTQFLAPAMANPWLRGREKFGCTMPVLRPGRIEAMPVTKSSDPGMRYQLLVKKVNVYNPLRRPTPGP